MKRLLFILLVVISSFASALFSPLIEHPISVLAQTNTFCAANLACTVSAIWTYSGTVNVTGKMTAAQANNIIYIDGTTYACSVAGLQSAITAAAALQANAGAVVDARGCLNPASGTTNVNIPGGVRVLLSAATWTWTATTNNACITISGDSASLVGIGQSNEDFNLASQLAPRTIISCQNLGATVNGVFDGSGGTTANAGGEVGNLMIQMGSSRTNLGGQDGFSTTALDGYWLHDIDVYYAARDCFRFTVSSGASFYRVRGEHLLGRVCGGSSSPTGYGFHWTIGSVGPQNEIRFTNWKNLIFQSYDSGNTTVPYGIGAFFLEETSSATVGDISDFTCTGCRGEGSVSSATGGGLILSNQSSLGAMANIFFDGLLEDNYQANLGTAVLITNGTPLNMNNIHTNIASANYATQYNYSPTNSSDWDATLVATSSTIVAEHWFDGIVTPQCSSIAATQRPNTGIIFSSATVPGGAVPAGTMRLCSDSAGRLNFQRADLATNYLLWDPGNNTFGPATDNTQSLGVTNARNWANIGTYKTSLQEIGAPSAVAGVEVCYGDSTAHTLKCSYNNGTFFNQTQTVASGTAAMTTALIAAGACGTTVTVAGAGIATTDAINFARNVAVTNANGGVLTLNAWPTSGNVNFNYCNPTSAGVTPTAMTLNWNVVR